MQLKPLKAFWRECFSNRVNLPSGNCWTIWSNVIQRRAVLVMGNFVCRYFSMQKLLARQNSKIFTQPLSNSLNSFPKVLSPLFPSQFALKFWRISKGFHINKERVKFSTCERPALNLLHYASPLPAFKFYLKWKLSAGFEASITDKWSKYR